MMRNTSRLLRWIAIFGVIGFGPSIAMTIGKPAAPSDSAKRIENAGAPINVSAWRYRKSITVAEEGVQQLELDLAVLSHATYALSDLRLVQDGRQIPYIIEGKPIVRSFVPGLRESDDPKRPNISIWKISLPHRGAPIVSLTLTSPTPYFNRTVRLYEDRPDETGPELTLASATWTRTPESGGGLLFLSLQGHAKQQELTLEIENGDNAPLDLQEPRVTYTAGRILFRAMPGTNIFLYYGNDKVPAPKYDLQLLTPRLLEADTREAVLGREERLRSDPLSIRFEGAMKAVFWLSLGAVVVGLLFIMLWLLPRPKPEDQPAEGSP